MNETSLIRDEEGFEIPEEYTLSSEKDCLMSLSLFEYNRWLNKKGASAERYRLECIKNHLTWKAMSKPKKIISSYYDSATNSLIAKQGFTFNAQKCEFEKVRK